MVDITETCTANSQNQPAYPHLYTLSEIPEALEIDWIIEGLLPEGLIVHGGRPECGKSWFALNVAISVATGRPLLDNFPTVQGRVLYMALEDSKARIRNRMNRLDAMDVDKIVFCNTWPKFDVNSNGCQLLEQWLSENPDVKLVVIDTWIKVSPVNFSKSNEYQFLYQHLSSLAKLARESSLGIMLIHHTKKENNYETEPNEKLLGSTAIAGASDCTLILNRKSGTDTAELHISGRDVADGKLRLQFQAGRYSLSESEQSNISNETDCKIMEVLELGPKRFTDVHRESNIPKSTANKALKRLIERGVIRKKGELYERLIDYHNKFIN